MARPLITAVLTTFDREQEFRRVEKHLRDSGVFADIIVWKNSPRDNRMVYGRYLAAAQARTPLIYTQDDDCLVRNIGGLIAAFDGKHLVSAMKPDAVERYESHKKRRAQPTLLGWGSVFRTEWISVLDAYTARYGVDSLLLREADRVFTVLLNRPHHVLPADIEEFTCARDTRALSMQKSHWEHYRMAVERAQSLLAPPRSARAG
jgi:hypothetical protein